MQVAPLRVRPADVADLQKLFVRGIAKARGQGSLTLTPEAVLQLESYSFPGNIKVCDTCSRTNTGSAHYVSQRGVTRISRLHTPCQNTSSAGTGLP